jgi:hypothetical protein
VLLDRPAKSVNAHGQLSAVDGTYWTPPGWRAVCQELVFGLSLQENETYLVDCVGNHSERCRVII